MVEHCLTVEGRMEKKTRSELLFTILVPRGHAPIGQHQESRPLDRSREIPGLTGFCREAQWPNGQCARSWSERSGFQFWSGTLCCVLGQDTLLSHCLSPPRSINGFRRIVGET